VSRGRKKRFSERATFSKGVRVSMAKSHGRLACDVRRNKDARALALALARDPTLTGLCEREEKNARNPRGSPRFVRAFARRRESPDTSASLVSRCDGQRDKEFITFHARAISPRGFPRVICHFPTPSDWLVVSGQSVPVTERTSVSNERTSSRSWRPSKRRNVETERRVSSKGAKGAKRHVTRHGSGRWSGGGSHLARFFDKSWSPSFSENVREGRATSRNGRRNRRRRAEEEQKKSRRRAEPARDRPRRCVRCTPDTIKGHPGHLDERGPGNRAWDGRASAAI